MNNAQAAHLWANKSRAEARGSNLFFTGDTIYSYGTHFPIARHYKGAILFTTKGYSSSTAKHKSHVARAIRGEATVFHVADISGNPGREQVADYKARVDASALDLARARSPYVDGHAALVKEANAFCEYFGFATRFAMPSETELAELKAKAALESKRKATQTKAKREREARELQIAIAEWLAGEKSNLPFSVNRVFLRVNGDNLQTSKGATVPLSDAKLAFRFIQSKRADGWHRNGEQFPVGEFHLDAVNAVGIVAGCHRIDWEEIERFAGLQGWV